MNFDLNRCGHLLAVSCAVALSACGGSAGSTGSPSASTGIAAPLASRAKIYTGTPQPACVEPSANPGHCSPNTVGPVGYTFEKVDSDIYSFVPVRLQLWIRSIKR
jgi:hypothetical protein